MATHRRSELRIAVISAGWRGRRRTIQKRDAVDVVVLTVGVTRRHHPNAASVVVAGRHEEFRPARRSEILVVCCTIFHDDWRTVAGLSASDEWTTSVRMRVSPTLLGNDRLVLEQRRTEQRKPDSRSHENGTRSLLELHVLSPISQRTSRILICDRKFASLTPSRSFFGNSYRIFAVANFPNPG